MFEDIRNIRKILVKGNNWLGDCVMSIPTINGLRRLYKRAEISVVTKQNLADLYRLVPAVDSVIGYSGFFDCVVRLRKLKFDLVVILPRSFSSAIIGRSPWSRIRVGYDTEGRGPLLTHRIKRSEDVLKVHRVHYYHNLLNAVGKPPPVEPPSIKVSDDLKEWVSGQLKGSAFIGLNPGATYGTAKRWYTDRFITLVRRLIKDLKLELLIFGTKAEKDIADEISSSIGNGARNFAGKTNISQLSALISRCKLFITNDTGPMHIADALGVPIVAVFGPTDPLTTSPFSNKHTIIRKELECSPCLERICPLGHHNCMKMIQVDEVFQACVKWLK